MVEKILLATSNKDKLRMLNKPVFLTPSTTTTTSYNVSIGTMSLFSKYPFLKSLRIDLNNLFTKSTIYDGMCIFFITSKTYNDWFIHMVQRPSMDLLVTSQLRTQ
mgnify:CR=1 FL=1